MNEPLSRKEIGKKGEQLAKQFLLRQGYDVIEQNWRCRFGEVDLIAKQKDIIVVIEVRTRSNTGTYGLPEESVNVRKQHQVRKTTQHYIHYKKWYDCAIRFDVISIILTNHGDVDCLRHISHAF